MHSLVSAKGSARDVGFFLLGMLEVLDLLPFQKVHFMNLVLSEISQVR